MKSPAIAPGFLQETILVRTGDGREDIVCEALEYLAKDGTRYRVPVGATTDGLSVPRCLQGIYPSTGKQWKSGVLHDAGYRNQLEVWKEGGWVCASLTQAKCDSLLLEAMETQGANWAKRQIFYRSLRIAGFVAFKDNRSPEGILRNRITAPPAET